MKKQDLRDWIDFIAMAIFIGACLYAVLYGAWAVVDFYGWLDNFKG